MKTLKPSGAMRSDTPSTALRRSCPSCASGEIRVFYVIPGVPAHSVRLMRSREEALAYPRGDISLGFCEGCGFIHNTAYDGALSDYSPLCEERQECSNTFNSFAHSLAKGIIDRYGIRNKRIIEIGCGKGEFLKLLCEMGSNSAVGFDPAYVKTDSSSSADIEFISEFYSGKHSHPSADLIVCKMALEHIQDTAGFLKTVRSSVRDNSNVVLFFQVPDMMRILKELAFWDIYYEHCSYFSPGSLARLFRSTGFDIMDLRCDYGGQYIICEARPGAKKTSQRRPAEDDLEAVRHAVRHFSENHAQMITVWKDKLRDFRRNGYRTALWGSGSKAVSFLTTLGVEDEIGCVVDINPRRQGTFSAGTGHEIVSPGHLKKYGPDAIIAMNPVYTDEIKAELERLGVDAALLTV